MSHGANSQKWYGTSQGKRQHEATIRESEKVRINQTSSQMEKVDGIHQLAIFHIKNLKIHIQREQHNCHTSNSYSFPFKELVNWKNCINVACICRIKRARRE